MIFLMNDQFLTGRGKAKKELLDTGATHSSGGNSSVCELLREGLNRLGYLCPI